MERYGGLTPLEDAVATLERECGNFGYPTTIRDQSSEFISRDLDQKGVELDFSRPGKPMDYALTSRSRKVGAECLNAHWFLSLGDAQAKMKE